MRNLRWLINGTDGIARFLAYFAGVGLLLLLAVLVANVLFSAVAAPLRGAYEMVSVLGVAVGGLALAEAQVQKSHVAVDILTARLPKKLQRLIAGAVTVGSVVLFAYLAYGLWNYGNTQRLTGAATEQLGIPESLSTVSLLIGVFGLVLVLVGDLGRLVRSARNHSPEMDIW